MLGVGASQSDSGIHGETLVVTGTAATIATRYAAERAYVGRTMVKEKKCSRKNAERM
jgi:hypothetical protein